MSDNLQQNDWFNFLYASKLIEGLGRVRTNELLSAARNYIKRNNLGAYHDLVNIANGFPEDDIGYSADEAAAIIFFWKTFGEIPKE